MIKEPELLVPAGNMEKLRFGLAYGADAVYAGAGLFSLRARENEVSDSEVAEAIDYTHSLGKKIYLTMNIYAHNNRVDRFLESFCRYSDLGPDGFIMADAGLIYEALKLRPNATIHLSTQANATNWATVRFWRDMGIKRVILSRELSLDEIGVISTRVPDVELEAFVHGSVCIAYSGRCLISNYLNHRDANEGTCTNSCRWEYKLQHEMGSIAAVENRRHSALNKSPGQSEQGAAFESGRRKLEGGYHLSELGKSANSAEKYEIDEDEHGTYLMNSRDLCAIELLPQLLKAGVCSLKIEGRNKSVFYLATVTRAYRQAIQDMVEGRGFDARNLREVMTTANRTLMTGFLLRRPEQYGENYDDGESRAYSSCFGGQVVDYDQARGLALVDFRNKVSVGDEVEWITPKETHRSRVEVLYDFKKGKDLASENFATDCSLQRVDSAHGGLIRGINCPFVPDRYTLLRLPTLAAQEFQQRI